MKSLLTGQIVYVIMEDYKDEHLFYRISRCKVKRVPKVHAYGYRVEEVDHMPRENFLIIRENIYETYEEALAEAIKKADKEDEYLALYRQGYKIYRPWEEDKGQEFKRRYMAEKR